MRDLCDEGNVDYVSVDRSWLLEETGSRIHRIYVCYFFFYNCMKIHHYIYKKKFTLKNLYIAFASVGSLTQIHLSKEIIREFNNR